MENKTLVMVDIQKEIEGERDERLFGSLYINKIMDLIKTEGFSKLVWIVDANKDTISLPSDLYNFKQYIPTEVYWKNYAVMGVLPPNILQEFINKFLEEHSKAYTAKGSDTLFIKTDNHHVIQEITPQILTFVESVKSDQVYLIGGAIGECIQDIEKVLAYYDVGYQTLSEYVYPVPYKDEPIYSWDVRNSSNPKGGFFLF